MERELRSAPSIVEQANGCHRASFDRAKNGDTAAADEDKGGAGHREPPAEPARAGETRPDIAPRGAAPPSSRYAHREQTLLDWLGHELRNPIAAIELAVHSMRELGDDRLDHPLSVLERQSRQLGRVVLELLEMARAMSQRPAIGLSGRHARKPEAEGTPPSSRERRPAGTPASIPAGRRRLLLVEDNEDLMDLLREMLGGWGFEVVAAETAMSALAKASVRPPDVALIDIGLPDRDGCEVARALRRTLPAAVRLFAMSGYGQRQDGARALAAGFDEFLVKPLNMTRLRRLLGEVPPLMSVATRDA